jgi:hypothetical protein
VAGVVELVRSVQSVGVVAAAALLLPPASTELAGRELPDRETTVVHRSARQTPCLATVVVVVVPVQSDSTHRQQSQATVATVLRQPLPAHLCFTPVAAVVGNGTGRLAVG